MDLRQKEELREYYCSNEMRELKKICDPIILRKGVPQMYYDDLYSDALKVLEESLTSFSSDGKSSFKTYLTGNIKRSFYDWTRNQMREKRCNIQKDKDGRPVKDDNGNPIVIPDISIDVPADDGIDLREKLASDFSVEGELQKQEKFFGDEKVEKFLASLGEKQRKILELLMQGCNTGEIKKELSLSDGEYSRQFNQIKSFENIKTIRMLFPKTKYKESMEEIIMERTQTAEKSKHMEFSIAAINSKIEDRSIRFDHPLQRESDQWSPAMKGNLISDILQDNPLPEIVLAEQIINGRPILWDLDGKQRCTNCYSFANDGFKISKNVRRWNIRYIAIVKDENNNPVLDDKGYEITEYREFDIRNKKFSQLPKELQTKFLEYTFKCDKYLNCDNEEIAYHIIRYNEGKAMSVSQKGITHIGEEFALMVKSISAMPFFRDRGGYKVSETKNGTLERVVIESVMASKYLKEWSKKHDVICDYLKENATAEDFDDFEDMVTRLNEVVTDETANMFDSKDSFLWFGLFARFNNTGEPDEKFVEFMAEFIRSLHMKKIGEHTWKSLNEKSTKDKKSVIEKLNYLDALMCEFLNIQKENTKSDAENIRSDDEEIGGTEIEEISNIKTDSTELSVFDFVKENVKQGITEEDIDDYYSMLDEYKVDKHSKLLHWENEPSLIALIAYSFENDINLDDWIVDFFNRNSTYIKEQRENYLYMKNDLEEYLKKKGIAA